MKTLYCRFCFFAFLISVSLLFPSLALQAQSGSYVVSGKVIDAESRLPLMGASVFAQNTTLGTVTNAEGAFRLLLPGGGYTIAVTFTGYETENVRVNYSFMQNDSLVIEMRPQVQSMEEVSIAFTNEVRNGWEKYGAFFTDNFIGKSSFAKHCVIKNPEALKFYFSKRKNQLKVITAEPLIVENFALGYTIQFAIDSFTNDYNTNTSLFIIHPLFTEMEGTDEQVKEWEINRMIAYKGSLLHFMRSLYDQRLQPEGFELQFIVKNNGTEYPIPLQNVYGALNFRKDDSSGVVEFRPNQRDMALIFYKGKPEAAYLANDSTIKKDFQLSTLTFPNGEYVNVERNGYFYDQQGIITNGYLAYKKIGDMLPYDYLLEKEEPLITDSISDFELPDFNKPFQFPGSIPSTPIPDTVSLPTLPDSIPQRQIPDSLLFN